MYVSLDWLKDFVDIPDKLDPRDLANELTLKTAEVESVTNSADKFNKMLVGHVLELHPHPNADKLKLAKVSTGKDTYQIVCGGVNLKEGMLVPVALPGAKVRWHGEGNLTELTKAKIRGEESYGMICASNEIGIDNPDEGPEDICDLSSIKPKIGTPLADILGSSDTILEFDNKSLTHRPDLWGHYGIAREIAAIKGYKFKPLKPNVSLPSKGESLKVKIEDFDLCPRYCGLIINNIKVEESPIWLKQRLKATEHGNHNNIVDVTNYVMTELGQPLHAFDKNYIKDGIIVRRAKKDEKFTSLDDKKRTLDKNMLVIADGKKSVAVAGIIGGQNSEINEKTTSIILEAANFNAANVRKTSTKLGIRTDSVQRFEKSLSPDLPELAILRAAELILKICPDAEIAGPLTDEKKFSDKPVKIRLDYDKARSKIGVEISDKEIKDILESLEFSVKGREITVPSHRSSKDIQIEDDLIEEIARIYGYENIPASLPSLPTRLPEENFERFKKHRTRELFSYGLGLDEVANYSFYGKYELKNCLMDEKEHVKLLNYLSEDQTHLRVSLVPNLLKNLQLNIKYFTDFGLYEIGRTYKEVGKYFPLEEKYIGGAILKKGNSSDPFYEAKGVVESFLNKFGIKIKASKGVKDAPYAHPSASLTYLAKTGETLAKVFILHPQVQKNHNLGDYSIALFEINFTDSCKLEQPIRKFRALPRFPGITIDISVLVDREIEIKTLREEIFKANKELINSVELFDIYEGEKVQEGKKAVAFKILLQTLDRTLTDEDMSHTQTSIFKNLESLGGKIRGKS